MKLSSTRSLQNLKEVLIDSNASGLDPVYWVFSEVSNEKWENLTVIASGILGEEFPKTYGHYHSTYIDETYKLIAGKGLLLLQKKHEENGEIIPNIIDEVIVIEAEVGDEIVITPEYGHAWINIGESPLVSLDDWRSGHQDADYSHMKDLQGLCYYVLKEKNSYKLVKNPKYISIPEPIVMSSKEFNSK